MATRPTTARTRADVVVVGAGPAGLAAAAACAEADLETVLVDAAPGRPWPQTFGAWMDELPAHVGADLWSRSWSDVRVVTNRRSLPIDRRYVLLDNSAVQCRLRGWLERRGGKVISGRCRHVRVGSDRLGVVLDSEEDIETRAVVDASGHRPALVTMPVGPEPARQTAYGLFGRFPTPPAAPGAMTFMDITEPGGVTASGNPTPRSRAPSFLYAMDLGDGRWLAEETSLAARPGMPLDELARRLDLRLHRRRAMPLTVERTERVSFPMGVPVPPMNQPVIGFGAAAGMVHPATGFQVARSLRTAPVLADALAEAMAAGAGVADTAKAGWAVVWTPDALRQRALHQLGLMTMLGLDLPRFQQFFDVFFAVEDWGGYVSGAASVSDLRRIMRRVFVAAPAGLRAAMIRAAVTHPGLVASVLGHAPRGGVRD